MGTIFRAVIIYCICILGLTGCGADSGSVPSGLAIITTSLPEGQVNQPYSASVGGSGGALPYLWSVTPALPTGLSLNTQSGAITGTATTVGTSSHTFTLVDSSVPPQTVATSLSLTIKPPLSITTTSLPSGNIGAIYSQPVQTVGGFGALTFNIVAGGGTLPPGFNLDTTTGAISGTATATGNFPFTVRVADASGQQDAKAFTIVINPQSPPQITTSSLPAGTVSVPYGPTTIQAAAGIGALTWSITAGSLPPGLTINSLFGPNVTISGTPTTQGTFPFTVKVTDTLGQFATRALSITVNLPAPPKITTPSLPAGTIGQPYNQAVLATGTGTLTYSLSGGSLPPGLTLNGTTGTIIGSPTATGTFPFTIRVTDTFGQSDTQALSIVVSTDNPPQIVPPSLPTGIVGVAYGPATLQATGGKDTVTWSISAGSLPPGLGISPSTGASVNIAGTPTTQGTFPFTVRVVDSLGQSDTRALSITINLPPSINITTTSLPGGSIGQAYSQAVAASGGTGARNWTISSGALPAGLNLDATTGEIRGTPIVPTGTSNFTVRVQDVAGQSDTQNLSITISLVNAPTITTSSLPGGTVGVAYGPAALQASGGNGTLTWTISAGSLPPGLAIPTGSSVISGTPTTQGTFNFTVRVVDSLGQSDTHALSIVINAAAPPPNPPVISTTTLPNGAVAKPYSQALAATGGTAPLTWSIVQPGTGTLPAGLNLTNGVIAGTPTTAGTSPFTVQVQDAGGLSDTQALSITIAP
jgi:hypothetical protein